jgi:hypothetical protein
VFNFGLLDDNGNRRQTTAKTASPIRAAERSQRLCYAFVEAIGSDLDGVLDATQVET